MPHGRDAHPGGRSGDVALREQTGSGDYATANDVVFLIPPGRPPIVIAAYYTGSHAGDDQQDAVLAAVGRIVAEHIG